MIQTIAMWAGFASVILAVFAIIVIYLTRKNILDILDKDVILFDKNFELKVSAIENALSLVDSIETQGTRITLNPEFKEKAKNCYNQLLCVVSDVRTADEFYSIVFENNGIITAQRFAQFKLMCRKDIGLKVKNSKAVKRVSKAAPGMAAPVNNAPMQPGAPMMGGNSTYLPNPRQPQMQNVQPPMPRQMPNNGNGMPPRR